MAAELWCWVDREAGIRCYRPIARTKHGLVRIDIAKVERRPHYRLSGRFIHTGHTIPLGSAPTLTDAIHAAQKAWERLSGAGDKRPAA
jgi:hypothetical protein